MQEVPPADEVEQTPAPRQKRKSPTKPRKQTRPPEPDRQIRDAYFRDAIEIVGSPLPSDTSGDGAPNIGPRSCEVELYHGDASEVLREMATGSVHCVITSPPYYGLRDYGIDGQLGHELHPDEYLDNLVSVFDEVYRVLDDQGSVWVNIGDTYWSGKGLPTGVDEKRGHKRFRRPQDRVVNDGWCKRKQLLLLPARFAIKMQEAGWIVRNDIIWRKTTPIPDPARDRCAVVHEYIFHFVKQGQYYYDRAAVAIPSKEEGKTKPPPTVWEIPPSQSQKKHMAVFPEQLVERPVRATCKPGSVLLDPFCGSGTTLSGGLRFGQPGKVVGIDLATAALDEARQYVLAGSGTPLLGPELS